MFSLKNESLFPQTHVHHREIEWEIEGKLERGVDGATREIEAEGG